MNRIVVVFLSVVITSCVTVAPVVNLNDSISIYGVSSLPPQNGDWSVLAALGYQMSPATSGSKKINHSLLTFRISVT